MVIETDFAFCRSRIQIRHKKARCFTRCFNVWNLIDSSDLSSPIDFLSLGCLLPPAKLPDIRMHLASSSYYAPVLHDDLHPRLQEKIFSLRYREKGIEHQP